MEYQNGPPLPGHAPAGGTAQSPTKFPDGRLQYLVARPCAAEGLDHVQFLTRLVELELIDRERRMVERRIKAARFPATKSLDSFDFRAIPKLNEMQVLELAR